MATLRIDFVYPAYDKGKQLVAFTPKAKKGSPWATKGLYSVNMFRTNPYISYEIYGNDDNLCVGFDDEEEAHAAMEAVMCEAMIDMGVAL